MKIQIHEQLVIAALTYGNKAGTKNTSEKN